MRFPGLHAVVVHASALLQPKGCGALSLADPGRRRDDSNHNSSTICKVEVGAYMPGVVPRNCPIDEICPAHAVGSPTSATASSKDISRLWAIAGSSRGDGESFSDVAHLRAAGSE